MHNVQCTIHNVQYTMYNVQCTLYNVQRTMFWFLFTKCLNQGQSLMFGKFRFVQICPALFGFVRFVFGSVWKKLFLVKQNFVWICSDTFFFVRPAKNLFRNVRIRSDMFGFVRRTRFCSDPFGTEQKWTKMNFPELARTRFFSVLFGWCSAGWTSSKFVSHEQ